MSAPTLAHVGMALVDSGKYTEAIAKLSQALESTSAPVWLLARSRAYIGASEYCLALADANKAYHVAVERANRDLMGQAQYRRAVAYMRLGRYADADRACIWANRLAAGRPVNEKDVTAEYIDKNGRYVATLEEMQIETEAAQNTRREGGLGEAMKEGSPAARQANMVLSLRGAALRQLGELPMNHKAHRPRATQIPSPGDAEEEKDEKEGGDAKEENKTAAAVVVPVVQTKLRIQDFQSNDNMTVSIFVKGVDRDRLGVKFSPTTVAMDNLKYPDGTERPFYIALAGEIDPSQSKFTVTPNKVELSLRKKTAGKWASLAQKGTEPGPTPIEGADDGIAAETPAEAPKPAPTPSTTAAAPSYPTSSKSGPKDWDHIGDEEEDESAQDINYFFKKLYKGATPEQQRAMTKSFVESNGTSLSTNWEDVKAKTVETVPPEGVDLKNWKEDPVDV